MSEIVSGVTKIITNKPYKIPTLTTAGEVKEVSFENYKGSYASEGFPLKINVTLQNDTLMAQATGQGSFPLTPVGVGKFEYKLAGIRILFESESGRMVLIQQGVRMDFFKEEE